ncbi:MAG: nuclear transport factor 2 family protein [Pseudomonadota bacterium]
MRRFLFMVLGVVLMNAHQAIAAQQSVHSAILQVTANIAGGADRHNWTRVKSALADQITTDYTSLFGGNPVTQRADELVQNWSVFLPGFDSTHHMVTSLMVTSVDGDSATAQANFTATHRIDKALWVLGGRYDYKLSKASGEWRVTSLKMTALWETGDRSLVKQAAKRAAVKK